MWSDESVPAPPRAPGAKPLNDHYVREYEDDDRQGAEEMPEHSWSECCAPPSNDAWNRQWGEGQVLDQDGSHSTHKNSRIIERELPADTKTSVVEQVFFVRFISNGIETNFVGAASNQSKGRFMIRRNKF